VQSEIGTTCPVFDVTNACNSFVDGLAIADVFIQTGTYKKILIATGEVPSKVAKFNIKDKDDFKKSFPGYTFGDAGTAVILESTKDDSGIFVSESVALSDSWDTAMLPGGGSRYMHSNDSIYFQGDGQDLKKIFDTIGPKFIQKFLEKNDLEPKDIDHIFVHQVSKPYLDEFITACNFTHEQVTQTITEYGNVAAATIPLGMSLSNKKGNLNSGDTILLIGLAGGISIRATLMRW
jgi:3-oxoacyl-[acyl-carrier-protein] synthase-3